MRLLKLLLLSLMAFGLLTFAIADEFWEEKVTCTESGVARIYIPENQHNMSAGGVIPHSESVNGSGVSFEKGAEPFLIAGDLFHYVDAEMFRRLDGQTSRFTQGLMRLSDMISPEEECPW